jgi:glycosyltransferase involved in cell wall biosynthesis
VYVIAHNGARIWGGAERATALVLKGLAERGHRVLLLCNEPLVRDRARGLGVPAAIARLGGDVAVPDALRFAVRLRRERPDALIVGTYKKAWLAALAARLAGVPRVLARVGLETDTPRSAKYRFVLARWVDAVAVNAGRMRAPFLALPGWTEERVATIHNGVHLPARTLPPGAVRASLGISVDAPVVGAVARLASQKRLDRLLRAVALLPPDVHCVLAGDGEQRGALQGLAAELGIAGRVHFLGHRADTADVLGALDLFAITSDREGMSNAMLEALAAGVPVASTAVSGADEALDPLADGRVPGVLVPSDVDGIAAALGGLLADRERLREMGAAARERAEERFSFAGMIDGWEALLARSAGMRRRGNDGVVKER